MTGPFTWGVATAAFQIEGSLDADGRGESIWDRFVRRPGAIDHGHTADVACDSYRLWRDDVRIAQDLGIDAYRFSISWPRVVPEGTGEVNSAGLDHYDRLVDALLDAGITPFPTLYHWDLPQALEDRGGWLSRDTAEACADYAHVVAERLGDRVSHWWTINEPWCIAELGYLHGEHAPGHRMGTEAYTAAHHVLLAHGMGMAAVRAAAPGAKVGIANHVDARVAKSSHPADVAAAELAHGMRNRWYLDPVLLGSYPQEVVDHYGWDAACVRDGDLSLISAPMDHLGINYYTRTIVQDPAIPDDARPAPIVEADRPRTTMGWEVYSEGLTDLLIRFHHDYDLPVTHVGESGVAFPDKLEGDRVHDGDRIAYLESHIAAVREAAVAGVPVAGYFVWSLMDNFEWARGYVPRFGLYWTDYESGSRIPKDSAGWYRDTIAAARS